MRETIFQGDETGQNSKVALIAAGGGERVPLLPPGDIRIN